MPDHSPASVGLLGGAFFVRSREPRLAAMKSQIQGTATLPAVTCGETSQSRLVPDSKNGGFCSALTGHSHVANSPLFESQLHHLARRGPFLVVAWNAVQLRSISSLEREASAIGEKISTALASGNFPLASSAAGRPNKATSATRGRQPRDRKELAAALDEIASHDLFDKAREALESLIIAPLIRQDPQLGVERSGNRIGSESSAISWQLLTVLRDWAKKNLAVATACGR